MKQFDIKQPKVYLTIIALVGLIIWHIAIANSKSVQLVGLFKEKPRLGYKWDDTGYDESRFFWQNTTAAWKEGVRHPDYNVVSSSKTGEWIPLPGYSFIGVSLITDWVPGQRHPTFKATSSKIEREWIPDLGYVFKPDELGDSTTVWQAGIPHPSYKISTTSEENSWKPLDGYQWNNSQDQDDLSVHWDSGLHHSLYQVYSTESVGSWRPYLGYSWDDSLDQSNLRVHWVQGIVYTDRHVVTGISENTFLPLPGYKFVDSTTSIDVVWTPGTEYPSNSDLIAGFKEDTWINKASSNYEVTSEPSSLEYLMRAAVYGFAGRLSEKISGDDNRDSRELYLKGIVEIFKSLKQSANGN